MLLAANYLVMSDCEHFWNVDDISKETEIQSHAQIDLKEFKDKRVLVLVHGYDNTPQEALAHYRLVYDHLVGLVNSEGKNYYEVVIGYLWPGYDDTLDYYAAKKHAEELATRTRSHLVLLSSVAAKVDILAHSMGNRLVFKALSYPSKPFTRKLVQKFFSLAPAIDDDDIEKKHRYSLAMQNCESLYVFYSRQDEVLEFLYTTAERKEALGFEGIQDLRQLPKNVQLVDCSEIVGGHSQYFTAPYVYQFIQAKMFDRNPVAGTMPTVKILKNGKIETKNGFEISQKGLISNPLKSSYQE